MKDFGSDERLAWQARLGSLGAYDALIERHQNSVLNLCYFVGNQDFAAAQGRAAALWIDFYADLKSLGFRQPFRRALFRYFVRRLAKDERDSPARRLRPRPDAGDERDVIQLLGELDFDQRVAVVLRDLNRFSDEELAAILGVTLGTVRTRVHSARLKLRDAWKKGGQL